MMAILFLAAQVISTLAGGGRQGDHGPASDSINAGPTGVWVSLDGAVWFTDRGNGLIRRVDPVTGLITSPAGNGDHGHFDGFSGHALEHGYSEELISARCASIAHSLGDFVSPDGTLTYSDTAFHRIRRVDPLSLQVKTIAGLGGVGFSGDGGPALAARFSSPMSLCVSPRGDVYVTDHYNARIRRINATDGTISTVIGGGSSTADGLTGLQTRMLWVEGVALDPEGNLYVCDAGHARVFRLNASTGRTESLLRGAGPFDGGRLSHPFQCALAADGTLYATSQFGHCVFRRAPDGTVTRLAGSGTAGFSGDGGPARDARLHMPMGVAVGPDGAVFIADNQNLRVRRVDPVTGLIATIAGGGTYDNLGDGRAGNRIAFNRPAAAAVDEAGNVYVADSHHRRIRRIDAATGIASTVAGPAGIARPVDLAFAGPDRLLWVDSGSGELRSVDPATGLVTRIAGGFGRPVALAVDGERCWVSDAAAGSVELVDLATGAVSRAASGIPEPAGLCVARDGAIYVCSPQENVVYRIAGDVRTVAAGPDGLDEPRAAAIAPDGLLLVADSGHHRVVAVASDGLPTPFVGTDAHGLLGDGGHPLDATLCHPVGLTVDGARARLLIADWVDGRIRQVDVPAWADRPPVIREIVAGPDCLWPPNHRMATVQITLTIEDDRDPAPSFELISIVSSEPDEGTGDGDTAGDIQGAATGTADAEVLLRAERSGPGAGRLYTLTYVAVDSAGNRSEPAEVQVCVAHDGRPGAEEALHATEHHEEAPGPDPAGGGPAGARGLAFAAAAAGVAAALGRRR